MNGNFWSGRPWSQPFACIAAVAALSVATGVPTASSAPVTATTAVVVEVSEDADPASVARRYGVVTDQVLTEIARGFSAQVTTSQLAELRGDRQVLTAGVDGVVGRIDHGQVSRFGGRSDPGAPPTSVPAQPAQFVTAALRRIGVPASRTADVDGLDDQRVDADIAVLDGGVDPYHPDLNVVGGYDCVRGPAAQRGYYDRDGHGTLVAGLAAAVDNGIGLVGAAPGARIWAVRVADPAGFVTESSLLCGLEYVLRNRRIEVANLSFGGVQNAIKPCTKERAGATPATTERDRVHQRICRVTAKGVTVVAAAGNEASDASAVTPAAYDEVITVSAIADFDGQPGGAASTPAQCLQTERDDRFASFSNYGRPVDIAAPGVCVVSTLPGGTYGYADGTSFAAPLVAGGSALILSKNPGLAPAKVRQRLLVSAEPGPIAGDPDSYPEGVLNVATY